MRDVFGVEIVAGDYILYAKQECDSSVLGVGRVTFVSQDGQKVRISPLARYQDPDSPMPERAPRSVFLSRGRAVVIVPPVTIPDAIKAVLS